MFFKIFVLMNKKINDGSRSKRSLEPVNAKLKCIEKKLVLLENKMVKSLKSQKTCHLGPDNING